MKILFENEVNADISLLDNAWSQGETFALLPDKGGVGLGWVEDSLAFLPGELATGHFVLLTSGSTGTPKLVVGQRHRSEELARTIHKVQNNGPVRQTIVSLPLSYCYAFVNQWLWARVHNRELVLTSGFTRPEEFRKTLETASDAMLCLVGAQMSLFRQIIGQGRFTGIIRVNFAGGRFPQEQLDDIAEFFPDAEVYNNYGCAEAMPRLTVRGATEAEDAANIGRPLPGVEMRTGDDGQMLFRSPFGAVAFVDEKGVHLISPEDWVATGDLGEANGDGSWHLKGRSSEVFKRYGEKISLPRITGDIAGKLGGRAVYYYREVDAQGEEGWVLVLSPESSKDTVREILRLFRASYQRPYWPLRIEEMAKVPHLPNGKVDTGALSAVKNKNICWRQR